ncbi:MAG: amidohydrolase [Gammaproteobacteria bacterium]|nr:amidohydrolase [Gammaproteobacteria bacterium]
MSRTHVRRVVLSWSAAVVLAAAAAQARQSAPADTIYLGQIRTLNPAAPDAQALAVRGETIVAVGTREAVLKLRGRKTVLSEIGSRTLVPGFIDSHGHLTATGSYIQLANLSSLPVGEVRNMTDLQETLRRFIRERAVPEGQWVVGIGYDDSLLAEKRHPTRFDLDAVSTRHPIHVIHVSGHLSAANSNLLALAEITAATPDPDGVLEELANVALKAKAPIPDFEQSLRNLAQPLEYYAARGVTTVQGGGASPDNLKLLTEAARRKLLTLDVVAYRFWSPVGAALPSDLPYGQYSNRLKVGGVKLVLDGSPQGKTAYLSAPYRVPPPGQAPDYRGYPSLPATAVSKGLREAFAVRVPVLAHANGDVAAEILVESVAAARRETGNTDTRVVMIHAQTVRDDQLDRMAKLNIMPSFFVGHTYYWGDWHRDETLGTGRAERINPTRSGIERGVPYTLHTDTPVVPANMPLTLWSATTRRTRSGDILGPQQRLTALEALQGLTVNGAMQYSEQDRKGTIEVGKQADFVILSQDPLSLTGEQLRDLVIEETVSRGQSVYRKRQWTH